MAESISFPLKLWLFFNYSKARKALTERQKDLEMKTQQLEVKLSNKTEEEIKKARRKSTQAGECPCPSAAGGERSPVGSRSRVGCNCPPTCALLGFYDCSYKIQVIRATNLFGIKSSQETSPVFPSQMSQNYYFADWG